MTIISELSTRYQKEQQKVIDIITGTMVSNEGNESDLTWAMLKLAPKKPTQKNIKHFVAHVNTMRTLWQKINVPLDFITPSRLEQLKDEALAADRANMKEMRSMKRYALATILLYMQTASAIDDLIQVLIIWLRSVEAQAKNKLEQYRLEQADRTDEYILILYKTLLALKHNETAQEKIREIEAQLGGQTDELIVQCQEYEEEVRKYYQAVWQSRNMKHMLIIKTLLYTGARVSELVHIRLSDVDFDRCQIRITQGKGKNLKRNPLMIG